MCGFFSSVFKKKFPNYTTPTFQEVSGVTQPPTFFVDGIRIFHGIALAITKVIDFYSQGNFTCLFATVFNCNEPERQLIAKLILHIGRF